MIVCDPPELITDCVVFAKRVSPKGDTLRHFQVRNYQRVLDVFVDALNLTAKLIRRPGSVAKALHTRRHSCKPRSSPRRWGYTRVAATYTECVQESAGATIRHVAYKCTRPRDRMEECVKTNTLTTPVSL